MSLRNEKVRKALMREISDILQRDIRDSRISSVVSITDVEVSHDNSSAKVYFSILGDLDKKELAFQALESHKSKIRYEIGKRIKLRLTPELKFFLDNSLERGMKVTEIIDKISKGKI